MRISDWSSDVCSSDLMHDWQLSGDWTAKNRKWLALCSSPQFHRHARLQPALRLRRCDFHQQVLDCLGEVANRFRRRHPYDPREGGSADGKALAGERRVAVRAYEQPGRLAKRSEEHTSELQSLMRISYAVFCLKKKNNK